MCHIAGSPLRTQTTLYVIGGELYSHSQLMGHGSVKVTEIYLEDFQSRQARVQHARFSPLCGVKPRKVVM